MSSMQKEWLIRKAKKHYLGPFDTATVKQLIEESEISAYDEIARSEQAWIYLKDCPPFVQTLEKIVPHIREEKTVNLTADEITHVTLSGQKPRTSIPNEPIKKQVIDLKKKRFVAHKLSAKTELLKRGWIGVIIGLVVCFAWWLWPEQKVIEDKTAVISEEQTDFEDPKLKELSETFRKFNLLFYQGKLEEQAGNTIKAIENYQKALEFKPADHRVNARLLALRMHNTKDLMPIRTQFLKILASTQLEKTDRANLQNYLGVLELKGERFQNAIPHLKQAIRFEPNFAPAHFNLGYAYFFKKEYYNARTHFDKAVQLQPNLPLLYLYLGRTLQKLNKNTEAIREYINANRINPNLHLPYLYLSFIHFKLKQRKKAFSYLEHMIRRDPDYDSNTYKDLRYMQEKLSYAFILKTYSVILSKQKKSSTIQAGLALLYYLDGQQQKAKNQIRQAIQENKQDPTAHMIYGYMLQKEGQLQEALNHLLTSIRYEYQNSLAHVLIADINLGLGRYQLAIEHCRKVFSFDPFYVRAYFTLGNGLVNLDRLPEAIKAFNKALEYDPNYMPAKKMLLQYSK